MDFTLEIMFFILAIAYVLIINRLGRFWRYNGWRIFLAPLHGAFGISIVITVLWLSGDITGAQWVKIWRVFQAAFIPFLWLVFKREQPAAHFSDIMQSLKDLERVVNDNIRRVVIWKH